MKWGFKKRLLWRPGGGAAGEPGFKGGGGTVGGPTDVHKIQEYMCNTLCSGVSVGVVVFVVCFLPVSFCFLRASVPAHPPSGFIMFHVSYLLFLCVSIIVTFLVSK